MTLLAAKQIRGQWKIFVDSWVMANYTVIDAVSQWRPKVTKIDDLIVAGSWDCRVVDFMQNEIEKAINDDVDLYDTNLKLLLHKTITEAIPKIKSIDADNKVDFTLLVYDTVWELLYVCSGYWIFEPLDGAEIVAGSWDTAFYQLRKYHSFSEAIKEAVKGDEFCDFPILTMTDEGELILADDLLEDGEVRLTTWEANT